MRPIDFTHLNTGELHRFVHAPGERTVVERNNWPVLTGEWPDSGETPYLRFGVNNNNTEEIAVYLGLIWEMSSGLKRFAIPAYYRDDAARMLDQEPRLVAWEYEVDAENEDAVERDVGFVRARTVSPTHERGSRDQAGLFAIESFDDLVAVTVATLGDASAEVSLFALADDDDRLGRLLDWLGGPRRPLLDEVLEPGERFFDLTVGVDLGYWDSLIVAAREDLSTEIAATSHRFERAIERYESRVDQTLTVSSMLNELALLAAGRS